MGTNNDVFVVEAITREELMGGGRRFEDMTPAELRDRLCGKARFGGDYHQYCNCCPTPCKAGRLLHAYESGQVEPPPPPQWGAGLREQRVREWRATHDQQGRKIGETDVRKPNIKVPPCPGKQKGTRREKVEWVIAVSQMGIEPMQAVTRVGYKHFNSFQKSAMMEGIKIPQEVLDRVPETEKLSKAKKPEHIAMLEKGAADILAGGDREQIAQAAGYKNYYSFRCSCRIAGIHLDAREAEGSTNPQHEQCIERVLLFRELCRNGVDYDEAAKKAGYLNARVAQSRYNRNRKEVDQREAEAGLTPPARAENKGNNIQHEQCIDKLLKYRELKRGGMSCHDAAKYAGYSSAKSARGNLAKHREEVLAREKEMGIT